MNLLLTEALVGGNHESRGTCYYSWTFTVLCLCTTGEALLALMNGLGWGYGLWAHQIETLMAQIVSTVLSGICERYDRKILNI